MSALSAEIQAAVAAAVEPLRVEIAALKAIITEGPKSEYVTPEEAARTLRCSLKTVYRRCHSGELRFIRPGGQKILIARVDLSPNT